MARTPPPVVGEQFGRWTVVGASFMRGSGHRMVRCRCECGTEQDVLVFALRKGTSRSCGCAKREQVASLAARTRWKDSHGYAAAGRHPLYSLWLRINKRCHNPRAHNYQWYGARGISVYEPWRNDAGAFIDWIERNLGPRPEGKSLDRIDNDGNYEPGNLRWATPSEQRRNSRRRR